MKNIGKINPLLQLIPRKKFNELCTKWEMDKGVRNFSTWEQTCALILTHIMRLESYREIDATLGVAKSTFSDANAKRSHGFFSDLCDLILVEIRQQAKSRKVRKAIKNLLAVDSSACWVHGSLFHEVPWWRETKLKEKKAGVKLHVIWNVDGQWVEEFRITPGRSHDGPVSKEFTLSRGKMYVFDRAYNDIGFWWKVVSAGSEFVGRLKGRQYDKKEILKYKDQVGILSDQEWSASKGTLRAHKEVDRKRKFRQVIYRDPETKKVFHFITSDFKISALEVAAIYKRRWAVEILFRWLKGHLNIRYFQVKNVNAVKILLSIAILVQLLVQLYKIITRFKGTLWECLRKLRTSLLRESLAALGSCPDCRWNALPDKAFRI